MTLLSKKKNYGEAYYKFALIGSLSGLPATRILVDLHYTMLRKISYKSLPRSMS